MDGWVFEWDAHKARANEAKHGISFDEAATIFSDPLALTVADPEHSLDERRFVTVGMSPSSRLLVVVHADRSQDIIRLISARRANATERTDYEEKKL